MTATALAAVAFAPGLFWLLFFYRRDRFEPEPRRLVLRTFVLGMVFVVPAALLEAPFHGHAVVATVVAPIVEELCKFAVVWFFVFRNPEFDEPMDGIVYAVAAALGFASAENALYVVGAYSDPSRFSPHTGPLTAAAAVFWLRALLSVPGHAVWSSMWGYALGWARFQDPARRRRIVSGGLGLAMLLHGAFNALLIGILPGALGLVVLVPLMWRLSNRRVARALAASPFQAADTVAPPPQGHEPGA